MIKDYSKISEAKCIIDFIEKRIKRGLGCNVLIIGSPGLGKSYTCLRIMELIKEKLGTKKKITQENIAKNLPDAFHFVRNVKTPGQCLTIEEVSVIAGSRRAMSADNVELNYLLDTVRKKQVILLMNSPHTKFIDSHIRMICQIQIECKKINKTQEVCIVSAKKLKTGSSGKTYERRFVNSSGWDIMSSYFKKPSKELCYIYEKQKDEFMDTLYELMEKKAKDRIEKDMKLLGKRGLSFKTDLTEKEAEVYREVMLKERTMTDYAKEKGVSVKAISNMVKIVQNKHNLLGKSAI